MIDFNNVTKKFDDFVAVEDVSFKVEPSSIYGLIGYNGAGKTTLLKTAAGIYKPEKGFVAMGGENTFDNDGVRKTMFYIPDDLYFPMGSTIKSMAKFYEGFYPHFSKKTLDNLLDVFGLDPKKQIRGFSKGMQRQAEIILALSSKPQYMLLDETFDGLDPQKKEMTKKLLLEYMAESECSLVISSHDLHELNDLCDHVGLINGKHLTMDVSIFDISENYIKIRLNYSKDISEADFEGLNYKSINVGNRVAELVFYKITDEDKEKLKNTEPVLMNEFNLNMEEVFLNEMEGKDYDITKIFQ